MEDFGCDLQKSKVKAQHIFEELEARDHLLVPYGRVNGLISPEERQANKEASKRKWEEEQEESFMWYSRGGDDEGVEQVPQREITTPPLPLVASSLLHARTPVCVSEPMVSTKR